MGATVVDTRYGKVQGVEQGPLTVWKGIPFARAPIGPLRFRPPQPPQAWLEVHDASAFGPACSQPPPATGSLLGDRQYAQSEDCLSLNIWSPGADGAGRPVMFWIHGGGFTSGSGQVPWYDGSAFATHGDVVVVTINYRLGFLGFLHLADLGGEAFAASGNCGILDQIASLQWVRDNIAAFGGDPSRVTIFGESAGAMSVGTLLGMPAAHGLFARAILQSGAAQNAQVREQASATAALVLQELDIDPAKLSTLQEVPVAELLGAQVKLALAGAGKGLIAQPVVDGAALPVPPLDAIRSGSAAGVDILIGTNREEMKLFAAMMPDLNDEGLLRLRIAEAVGTDQADHLLHAYTSAAAEVSSPGDGSTKDALIALLTDRTFRIPAIELAEAATAQRSRTWMYRFDWRTPAFGGRLGAAHAVEIPFVFDNLDKPGVGLFTGDSPVRQEIATKMHSAWIAFARHGDPNTAELPAWPAYDVRTRETMIFNEICGVEADPDADKRRAWVGLL